MGFCFALKSLFRYQDYDFNNDTGIVINVPTLRPTREFKRFVLICAFLFVLNGRFFLAISLLIYCIIVGERAPKRSICGVRSEIVYLQFWQK